MMKNGVELLILQINCGESKCVAPYLVLEIKPRYTHSFTASRYTALILST